MKTTRRGVLALLAMAALALCFAPAVWAQNRSYAADSVVIPMDTAYQDNGVFVAFGLMDALLRAGLRVDWAIQPGKGYGDTDFTAPEMVDMRSGAILTSVAYSGGPFVVDADSYTRALPIIQAWQAKYSGLAAHRAALAFSAPIGRTLLASPNMAIFSDGNEDIAFGYLNAAAIPQGMSPTSRQGNRITVAVTASARPTVTAAPAGNSTVTGTSTEAPGSEVDLFVDGLYAGSTTVQAGSSPYPWSLGPVAVPPGINVTAVATASGKATSPVSANRASGTLPAGGTSSPPVISAPLLHGDSTLTGTSTEADGTIIRLFKDGVLAGTAAVASGRWRYVPAAAIRGGDTWNATATAPSKTESGLSNFVVAVPVAPVVTGTAYAPGATKVQGSLKMPDGTVVTLSRRRASVDTVLGTASLAGMAWSLTVAGTSLQAGDVLWATAGTHPYPGGKGSYACPGVLCCPTCVTEAQVKGPTTTLHNDGALFDGLGNPKYCQFMSMHYGAPGDPEAVAEVRSFLQFQTHAFLECQAVNAFENDPVSGHFLSTNGLVAGAATGAFYFFQDVPFAQATGPYVNPGGSEKSYSLASGSTYYSSNVVHLSARDLPNHGQDDEWMSGHLDGDPTKGKVSFLGGHEYTTTLPLSSNGKSQGVRYFLNSLYEAPCTSEAVADLSLTLTGPASNTGGNSTYAISFTSSGVGIIKNVRLELPLPSGTSYVSSTGGGTLSGSTIAWNLGDLLAGSSGSVQFTVSFSSDGTYPFQAQASWLAASTPLTGASNSLTTVRDTLAPSVAVNPQSTTDRTPTLSGTVDDPTAAVRVTVEGTTYTATNNGDGTWTLADDTLSPALACGVYDVLVTATDPAGNIGSDTTTDELAIHYTAPAVNGPVTPMADTLTGTSASPDGTLITVYQNVVPIGTTMVTGGAWSLTGFPALTDGATITATAGTGGTTSAVSAGVVVSVALLRFGGVTQLSPQSPANSAIFVTPAQAASLSLSRDLEKAVFPSGDAFAHEVSDLDAEAAPLVFYQVAGEDSDTLRVTLSAGKIVITH